MTNKEVKSWLDIIIQDYIYEDVEDELIEMRDIIYNALDTQSLEKQPSEDYISKAALLARIDEERKHLLDLKMDGAEHIIVHHARRIIEDMPTVTPRAEWIPVTERLPKEEGWYLVSLGNAWDKNNLGKVIQGKKIYDSHVRLSQYKDGKFYHGMVAAWMDKPEPYKEITEEEVR